MIFQKSFPALVLSASCALIALSASPMAIAAEGFEWKDTEGKHMDLLYQGRPVVRYQYERINEERRDETYKPYHQVYDWEGKGFITKGHGGKFPHHRGIYFGFSKCSYVDGDGKEVKGQDTWHCRKAFQTHEKFLSQHADENGASHTVEIAWHGDDGTVFLTEERTLTFSFLGEDLMVDFKSKLKPEMPKVTVDGDPQHAGFQFRASNEVSEKTSKQTYYIRPKTGKDVPGKTINWSGKSDTEATRDLPWKVMSVVVGGDRYSVAYLNADSNPKPTRFSERDYGRFGGYFVHEMTPETPLTVNYRLAIRKGEYTVDEAEELRGEFSTQ